MTPFQRKVYDYVVHCWSSKGISPSYDEIKVAVETKSKTSVHRAVKRLVEDGWLVSRPNGHRTLRPTDLGNVGTQGP